MAMAAGGGIEALGLLGPDDDRMDIGIDALALQLPGPAAVGA